MRHLWQVLAFVVLVGLPTVSSAIYLFAIAKDQYTSSVGFAVRSESITSALGLLGGLSSLSGASSSDTDILNKFIQSQELVQKVDAELDLRALYSKPDFDPVFAFDTDGSIEDLTAYWQSMVKIFYDNGTGLIELRVHAFDPDDALRIAQAIFNDSAVMINELSATARNDATRYAREELDRALERLSQARIALTQFRSQAQIVDPSADIQSQMGVLNKLQQELAASMIEMNLLLETASKSDPRIAQSERRITVIEGMIASERRKFGVGSAVATGEQDFSVVVGEFERLTVEREFAEKAYLVALTSYDNAQAEAQRKSRYLAAYTGPTKAERALYPRRAMLTAIVFSFSLLFWAIAMLVYYSVRDRR